MLTDRFRGARGVGTRRSVVLSIIMKLCTYLCTSLSGERSVGRVRNDPDDLNYVRDDDDADDRAMTSTTRPINYRGEKKRRRKNHIIKKSR